MDRIYSRWGREMSDNERWSKLKNRLKLLLDTEEAVSKSEAVGLAFALGVPLDHVAQESYSYQYHILTDRLINNAGTAFELAELLQALVRNIGEFAPKAKVAGQLLDEMETGIKLMKSDDGWLALPRGEAILDRELVEKPLSFLSGEPLKQYTKALEFYKQRSWEEASEKTRRTLEEYLRMRLGTTKGLDKSIKTLIRYQELGVRLKEGKEVPAHLRTTITNILAVLDTNYNEASKHHSKTYGEIEVEFLIYQVGLLLRLLDKIDFKAATR